MNAGLALLRAVRRLEGAECVHAVRPRCDQFSAVSSWTCLFVMAMVVFHIQSRCISRELRSRVLTADIPTQRQDNGRGPLGHRAHASSPPALGRAPLACPGNRQPTAASRQRTPGTRGGPHVRRVVASAAFPLRRGPLPLRGRRRRPLLVFLKGNAGRQRLRFPLDIRPDIARGKCWSPPLPFRFL